MRIYFSDEDLSSKKLKKMMHLIQRSTNLFLLDSRRLAIGYLVDLWYNVRVHKKTSLIEADIMDYLSIYDAEKLVNMISIMVDSGYLIKNEDKTYSLIDAKMFYSRPFSIKRKEIVCKEKVDKNSTISKNVLHDDTISKNVLLKLHKKKEKKPPIPGVSEVRKIYFELFFETMKEEKAPWGAIENTQCGNLLKTYPLDKVLLMVRHYFAFKPKNSVRDGYPFSRGYSSINSLANELYADVCRPERLVEDISKMRVVDSQVKFLNKAREVFSL